MTIPDFMSHHVVKVTKWVSGTEADTLLRKYQFVPKDVKPIVTEKYTYVGAYF